MQIAQDSSGTFGTADGAWLLSCAVPNTISGRKLQAAGFLCRYKIMDSEGEERNRNYEQNLTLYTEGRKVGDF